MNRITLEQDGERRWRVLVNEQAVPFDAAIVMGVRVRDEDGEQTFGASTAISGNRGVLVEFVKNLLLHTPQNPVGEVLHAGVMLAMQELSGANGNGKAPGNYL